MFSNISDADQRMDKTFAVSFTRKKKQNDYGEWIWTGSPKITNYYKTYWQGPMNGFTTKTYKDSAFADVPLEAGWVHSGDGEVAGKCTDALNKVTAAQSTALYQGLTLGTPKDCWWLKVKMGKYWMIKTSSAALNKTQNFI